METTYSRIGIQGLRRQPDIIAIDLGGFLAGINLHPLNLAAAVIGLGHRGIYHLHHDGGDIDARAVALNIGDDGLVGDPEGIMVVDLDLFAAGGHLNFVVGHSRWSLWVEKCGEV
jgi:hypothetical protein